MRKILSIILLTIFFFILLSINTVTAEEIYVSDQNVIIKTENDYISVKESIKLNGSTDDLFNEIIFWIPSGSSNIVILINNNPLNLITQNGNEYIYDVSGLKLEKSKNHTFNIEYRLNKNTENYQRKIIYETQSLIITFDNNQIFKGNEISNGTILSLSLYSPTETPLGTYIIIAVVLLIILLIVFTIYSMKKQKKTKKKSNAIGSEELFSTKKILLMELLKEVEKKHRAKQISDDTYHKIKEQYKQEAVDAMKKLEDLKLKVK